MRRWLSATVVAGVALLLIAAPRQRRSVEDVFFAQAQAAAASGNLCTMPPLEPLEDAEQDRRLAVPTSTAQGGADLPPVRMVVDPYPSFNGVAVDPEHDLVMMSDTNRKSLLVYPRGVGAPAATQAATPLRQIMGPDTGVGFVA